MGNRALIVFNTAHDETDETRPLPALYLHWNGGPESVYAFIDVTKQRYKGKRPDSDMQAFAVRMIETIAPFFPDGLSVYLSAVKRSDLRAGTRLENIDPGDNGVYYLSGDKVNRAANGEWFSTDQVAGEHTQALENKQYTDIVNELQKAKA